MRLRNFVIVLVLVFSFLILEFQFHHLLLEQDIEQVALFMFP